MAISLTDFASKFGKGIVAEKAILDNARTTVPAEVEDFIQEFDGDSEAIQASVSGVSAALNSYKTQSAGSAQNTIANAMRLHMQQVVKDDNPTATGSLLDAVREFVRQMEDGSATFDEPTVSAVVTPAVGNTGDGVAVVSTKDGYGNDLIYQFPEKLEGKVISASSSGSARFQFDGEESELNPFSVDFPGGSGQQITRTSTVGGSTGNLIGNASFTTGDDTDANLPAGWIAKNMDVGTTILLTDVEVQRIAITSTPTAGYYQITYTAASGEKQTTGPIDYNAEGSAVESALQALKGLGSVSVATTGTSPNYTHDITFNGVKKPGATLTVETGNMTGGTITPTVPTAGSAYAVRGPRAMQWDPDGVELQTMHYPVSLATLRQYVFGIMAAAAPVPASGVITVDLVDGIDGTVIQDEQGTNNSFTIDPTALTGTPALFTGIFRTPKEITTPQVYLRLRASTVLPAGGNVFFDQPQLRLMQEVYVGGPSLLVMSGNTDWAVDDRVDVQVNNDRGGEIVDWMDRTYSLRENRIILPHAATGTLPDATYIV